jgi:hypothetical protein
MFCKQRHFCTLRIGNYDSKLQRISEKCASGRRNFCGLNENSETTTSISVYSDTGHVSKRRRSGYEAGSFRPDLDVMEKRNICCFCRDSNLCSTKWHWGRYFTEYFGFSSQFSFYRPLHTHQHLSSEAGIINSVRHIKWTQFHPTQC